MKNLFYAMIMASVVFSLCAFLVHISIPPAESAKALPGKNPAAKGGTYSAVYDQTYDRSVASVYTPAPPLSGNNAPKPPEKVVYLTIDDGPNPKSTPEYLSILSLFNVKATFFMIGSYIESNPELVRAVDAEGHVIGNHSFTHDFRDLYKNPDSLAGEILKTEDIIYSITGKRVKIFRPPGGSSIMSNSDLFKKLDELGYAYFDWNATAADTSRVPTTKRKVIDSIVNSSRNVDRVIVLMHDKAQADASLEALPEVIVWFQQQGYSFETLNENVKPIHMRVQKKVRKARYRQNSPVNRQSVPQPTAGQPAKTAANPSTTVSNEAYH